MPRKATNKSRKVGALKAKRIDENASVSSALESQPEDNDYFEEEIRHKIQRRDEEFEEGDLGFGEVEGRGEEGEEEEDEEEGEETNNADEFLDKRLTKYLRELQGRGGSFRKFYETYKMLIQFYLSSKAEGKRLPRDHPAMKYLLECQQLVPVIEAQERKADREATATQKLQKTTSFAEASAPEAKGSGPLLITKEMLKNKGIPKRKSIKKKSMTPKMKQKSRFKKAEHKMRSKGRRDRDYNGVYEGERKGLKMSINRTVNI